MELYLVFCVPNLFLLFKPSNFGSLSNIDKITLDNYLKQIQVLISKDIHFTLRFDIIFAYSMRQNRIRFNLNFVLNKYEYFKKRLTNSTEWFRSNKYFRLPKSSNGDISAGENGNFFTTKVQIQVGFDPLITSKNHCLDYTDKSSKVD